MARGILAIPPPPTLVKPLTHAPLETCVKILVVEDETPIRKNLVMLLRMNGYEVIDAPDGRAALQLAREQLPTLILSDVMMPVLDGFGLLEQLRQDPLTSAIPLIFLTARSDRSDMRRGMNLGADDYLSKPFSREEVLDAVAARLRRSQTLEKTNPPPAPPAAEPVPSFGAPPHPQLSRTLPTAEPAPPKPVSIKGYRLTRKIGGGGMSEVFLAVRESDHCEVALKVLDTRINQDEALLHRFIQEYALLAEIKHPNVARIFDQGFADENAFITMEYFSRGDIKRCIAAGMTPAQALGVTVQVAMALAQVHAQGIVHRDLKPDNLMLREDGSIALIDFGVAKHAGHELGQTLHGEIVGSPYYLSPEQASGRTVSPASDIYALGVIFHELLTGCRPFTADRMETLLALHLFSPTPELKPPHATYQALLDRMMHKDPHRRFVNAQAIVEYILARWPEAGTARL